MDNTRYSIENNNEKPIELVETLDGIVCPNCVYEIKSCLAQLDGVHNVKVNYIKSEVRLDYDAGLIDESEINDALSTKGFPPGKGRSNLLTGTIDIVLIIALYFAISYLTGAVHMPDMQESMSMGLVFLTGLLGGFHCIGMCGGIMLAQNNSISYNFGRVIGYSLMGLVFGAVGSYLVFSTMTRGIVFSVAGLLVVLIGLRMWGVPLLRRRIGKPGVASPCTLARFRGTPFLVGLLTGLMPCGMLSSMWFVAATSGSAAKGMLTMLIFALGTSICMLIFGLIGDILTRKYNKYILKASTIIIITMGLMLMIDGLNLL